MKMDRRKFLASVVGGAVASTLVPSALLSAPAAAVPMTATEVAAGQTLTIEMVRRALATLHANDVPGDGRYMAFLSPNGVEILGCELRAHGIEVVSTA